MRLFDFLLTPVDKLMRSKHSQLNRNAFGGTPSGRAPSHSSANTSASISNLYDASEYIRNEQRRIAVMNTDAGSSQNNSAPHEKPKNPLSGLLNENEETTVISKNTIIVGSVTSCANIQIQGSIQGNIDTTKDMEVSGKITGNIRCKKAALTGAQLQGTLSSNGVVQIDRNSLLLCDITAQDMISSGRIKGNINLDGGAAFGKNSVTVGDISAAAIEVNNGAIIKGYVNIADNPERSIESFPTSII